MGTKPLKPLTEKQIAVLRELHDVNYRFPWSGPVARVLESLRSRGLVEQQLALANRDFTKGSATFKPAFRRTTAGREAIGC